MSFQRRQISFNNIKRDSGIGCVYMREPTTFLMIWTIYLFVCLDILVGNINSGSFREFAQIMQKSGEGDPC